MWNMLSGSSVEETIVDVIESAARNRNDIPAPKDFIRQALREIWAGRTRTRMIMHEPPIPCVVETNRFARKLYHAHVN